MTTDELVIRLRFLELDSDKALALVRDLLEDARYPSRVAIQQYLAATEAGEAVKGMVVLEQMAAFSLKPLSESQPMADVDREVWVLRLLRDELFSFRWRVATSLAQLFEDKRLLATLVLPQQPTVPAGTRVCDLAFILLQEMARVQQPAGAFLNLPQPQRDVRIINFQATKEFRRLIER